MAVRRLEHYNILTTNLDETIRFYGEVLGMRAGPSPSGNIKESAWIYDGTGTAVVHLQSVDPVNPEQRFDKVRERLGTLVGPLEVAKLKGGGAIEHVAFECDDFDGTRALLTSKGIPVRENYVEPIGLRQLFLNDPNGVTLELNFR